LEIGRGGGKGEIMKEKLRRRKTEKKMRRKRVKCMQKGRK
jgi:hypothetical protein